MKNNFKLTKETDPRCNEFYVKAFPELTNMEQINLKDNWIKNNIR